MWLYYVCDKDKIVFAVNRIDKQVALLGVVLSCPICRENISIDTTLLANPPGYKIKAISALELFQASSGVGFSDEQTITIERVKALISDGTLVALKMAEDGERVVVDFFTIDSPVAGKHTFHLGTSTKGVIIYKITD